MSDLPTYRVIYADGSSYITSMSKTTTLQKARDYFIDASLEQPDGSCKRVADVQPVNEYCKCGSAKHFHGLETTHEFEPDYEPEQAYGTAIDFKEHVKNGGTRDDY